MSPAGCLAGALPGGRGISVMSRSGTGLILHLAKALPAPLDWSARYHHLREVTRDDIQDHVRGLHGSQRHNALVALILSWPKEKNRTGARMLRDHR